MRVFICRWPPPYPRVASEGDGRSDGGGRCVAQGAGNAPGGGSEGLTDAVFARLVQGVRSQAAQVLAGNQSGQTVAAFLQTLGDDHSIVPGEGRQ